MSRLCMDTCAYSELKRGTVEAVEALRHASWVGVPTVVLGELHAGFLLGDRVERNERELSAFLEEPVVSILEVDAETAHQYAAIVVGLRRAGTPLPTNDVWIAACAMRYGAAVVTLDAHFGKVAGLDLRLVTRG